MRALITESINIVTGALGAGKTLFAIQQADLLRKAGEAKHVYQVGINEPDLRKLPALPFPLEEWHIHADAGDLENAVVIVDEFHKWMPQRSQNSRPPKFIEEMAEARKRDVRFLLLTQSTEFDHFLKGTRLNRHFYVARKAGLGRARIFEWQNRFVSNPEENENARKAAIQHIWKHPAKEYGDWYVSAKAHRHKFRLPLRGWLAVVLVPTLIYFIVRGVSGIGGILDGSSLRPPAALDAPTGSMPAAPGQPAGTAPVMDLDGYVKKFEALHPALPWSAPAYQGRSVVSDPQLYCVQSEAGTDANGVYGEGRCTCFTEQMTRHPIDETACLSVVRDGIYNPYKAPIVSQPQAMASTGAGQSKSDLSLPSTGGSIVDAAPSSGSSSGGSHEQVAQYGGFRQ